MKQRTAEEIFRDRMGFPDDATGPYVTELREWVHKQVNDYGMRDHSYGSWVGDPSHEERARALLASIWEREHGHSHRVENLDGWLWVRRLVRRREYRRAIKAAWATPADWFRARRCDAQVFWNKRILRRVNPYNR